MKKHKSLISYLLILFLSVVALGFAVQGSSFLGRAIFENDQLSPEYDLTIEKVIAIITGFTCWAAEIAILILIGALFFYGIQILFSRGNPVSFQSAKKAFSTAIIGAFVILGVYTIIATVANTVGVKASFIPLSCPKIL